MKIFKYELVKTYLTRRLKSILLYLVKITYMKYKIILGISIIFVISLLTTSMISAQSSSQIPQWIKAAVTFWVNDQVSDQEFINAIQYFVENEIIHVPPNKDIVSNLHMQQAELNEKIRESRILANNIKIQNFIVESNTSFAERGYPEEIIKQVDERWQSSDPDDPDSIAYYLINNEGAQIIRQVMQEDMDSESKFKFAEIFITNVYGANVSQSGKTTDYRQDDEQWWQEAKKHGIFLSEGGFDESAGVYSTDIAIQVLDREGRFIGVLKSVISLEPISSGN